MPTLRVPLVGSLTSRDAVNTALFGSSQKDQYFEDCVFRVTKNELTGKVAVRVGPRELFTTSGTPSGASGNGTAVMYWRGKGIGFLASAFGSTNSTIYVNDTSLGAISGLAMHFSETILNGTPNLLVTSLNNKAYFYPDGGALTEITDAQFPSNNSLTITGNFAHMDGYAFIMDTRGTVWHSDVNSLSAWTATSSIPAQEYPDIGIGVARHRNFVVGFSQVSMEFFNNTGNATGAVLSRVQHMARQIGLVNPHCLVSLMDTLMFVGRDRNNYGVYMLNQGVPEKISSQAIDYWLDDVVNELVSDATVRLNVISSHGRPYLALSVGSSSTINCYVYDFDTRFWHPWTLEYQMRQSDVSLGGTSIVGHSVAEIVQNGGSNGFASATIQTMPLDCGSSNRKYLKRLRLIGNKASATSNVDISWSDDDGQNYTSARTVDMASANPQLMRCGGAFRRRSFRLTGINVAATDREQLLEALELEYEDAVT